MRSGSSPSTRSSLARPRPGAKSFAKHLCQNLREKLGRSAADIEQVDAHVKALARCEICAAQVTGSKNERAGRIV
jgi:hypothetical protein